MKNKITSIIVEADWSYFSDPVRITVGRMFTTDRVYRVRPASAIRAGRAVSELIRRIAGKRAVLPPTPAAVTAPTEPDHGQVDLEQATAESASETS